MTRKSKGRQKVNMVKMQNESNLQVTFSKRRSGLFKKASELCTLCGAEIAIIVFSPGQKVYSFGHPCVDSIVERYLSRNPPPNGDANQLVEAHRNASVRELNMELTHVESLLEGARKHGETLDQMRKISQSQFWWAAPKEELNLQQLEKLKAAMEDLKLNVDKEVHKLMYESANHHGNTSYGRGIIPFDARATNAPNENVPFGHRPSSSMGGFPFDNRSSGFNGGNPFADRTSGSINGGSFPFLAASRASGSNAVPQYDPRTTADSSGGSKMPQQGLNFGYGRGGFF